MKSSLAKLTEIKDDPAWQRAFANQRKDRRYFQIVEETLNQGFEHYYLVFDHPDGRRAIQPIFVHDQDLLAGSPQWVQKLIAVPRKILPRFLKLRTLMVGCPAGEGRLEADWVAQGLAESLMDQAKKLRCGMIVMKEFHGESRGALQVMKTRGFTFVPSLPMTRLNIAYANFEEYMTKALSKATRKDLRRKFKSLPADAPVEMSLVGDITECVDEVIPLYEAVYNRSKLHFEKLNREFLIRLGRDMADKVRFFVWRQNGRAVALSICLIQGDVLFDEYVGLDYSVALDLHLYFVTLRDLIQWGIEHQLKWYCSTALCYEPKLHLRCELEPLDLFVRHTNPVFNFFLARVLPWLEPTRNDPALKKYPNYHVLWGEK